MSSKTRNNLKSEFVAGTAATAAKFEDLIDSSYNTAEDSVLLGPLGQTGKYGLLGPTGGTYTGLFISNGTTAPTAGKTGRAGEIYIDNTDTYISYLFIHNGTQWTRFQGDKSW